MRCSILYTVRLKGLQHTARCTSIWYMNVYFCDIYITARPRTPTDATRPGLKASRSASLGMKSSAPADSRGALWGVGHRLSAVGGRILLGGAYAWQ